MKVNVQSFSPLRILPILFAVIVLSISAQSQTGLFIDYTQSGWNLNLNGAAPNQTSNYTMVQSAGTGSITFALALNGTYANPQPISITTDANGNGSTPFWVKGTGVGPATWQWCQGATCGGNLQFTVVTISSLEFVDIDSPLDINPDNGCTGAACGKRIYPDKTSPGDTTNRQRVRVRATLSAPFNAMEVYFKSFDLDDPSANTAPVDTNGSTGDDNRAAGNKTGILAPANQGGLSNTLMLVTSPQGVAEADFTVTMNPGDNFMVAAGGDSAVVSGIQIDGITLKDAGNNTLPVTKAKNTPMLTVWRKLHLEVDNMGAVGTNHETGTVQSASVMNGRTTMVLNNGQTIEDRRYASYVHPQTGGIIRLGGQIKFSNKTYDVYSNSTNQVVVDEVINPLSKVVGKSFTIYDDDDYNGLSGLWLGDENESSVGSLNALTKLTTTNVLAPAYITPVNDGGGDINNNGSSTFVLNVTNDETQIDSSRGSAGDGSDDFWISSIQMAYQSDTSADGDPDDNGAGQTSPFRTGRTVIFGSSSNSISSDCSGVPRGGYGTLLFQETIHDWFTLFATAIDNRTGPHELAHQFGLGHIANTIMDDGTGTNNDNFDPAHLHMLRCRVKSPGYN